MKDFPTPAPWHAVQSGLEWEVLGDVGNPEGPVRICSGLSKRDAYLIASAPELFTRVKTLERQIEALEEEAVNDL